MIHIHIEPKILIIRWGKDFEKFGDQYDSSVSVSIVSNEAHFYGMTGYFTFKIYAEIRKQLTSMGIARAHWERKKNGKAKLITTEGNK
mgnify:CR=1 FL=1